MRADDEQMALLLRQACTHDSFARYHNAMYPLESPPPTNGMLASLGNSLLGLFATEYLNASYPHLPTRALKAATNAYVGHMTCVNVATEIGVGPLVRWQRKVGLAFNAYGATTIFINRSLLSPLHPSNKASPMPTH